MQLINGTKLSKITVAHVLFALASVNAVSETVTVLLTGIYGSL